MGAGLHSPLCPRGPPPGSQPPQTSSDLSPSPGLERDRPPPWLPAPYAWSCPGLHVPGRGHLGADTVPPAGLLRTGRKGGACTGQCGAPGPQQGQLGAPETGLPRRSVGGGSGEATPRPSTPWARQQRPNALSTPRPPFPGLLRHGAGRPAPAPELLQPLSPGALDTRAAGASAVDHAPDSAKVHPHPVPGRRLTTHSPPPQASSRSSGA